MYLRHFTTIFFMFACLAVRLPAQPIHLPYRHFTLLDGLAQQQVTALLQDSRGYIWIGTKGGLSKFDGEHFETFRKENGLPALHVTWLGEDGEGMVWASTEKGAAYFDGVRWKGVYSKHTDMERLDGKMYGWEAATKTFWRMDRDTARMVRSYDEATLRAAPQKASERPGVWNIAQLPDNDQYIFKVDGEGQVSGFQSTNYLTTHYLPMPSGEGWLHVTRPGKTGFCQINQLGQEAPFDSLRLPGGATPTDLSRWVYAQNGDAYFSSGVKLYRKPAGQVQASLLNIPITFPSAIMQDAEGAIWIGTEAGLFQYFPNGFSFLSDKDAPMTWNMAQDNDGTWWLGSYGHGLRRFDGQRIDTVSLPKRIYFEGRELLYFYFGASKDHLGNLYFSSDNGLITLKNGRFRNLNKEHHLDECLGGTILYNFFDPIDRKVLVGMRSGMAIYDPETDTFESLFAGECNHCYVLSIARDRKDNYWFSTGGWLVRYHIPTKAAKVFRKKDGDVPFRGAYCIEADPAGGVWFGSVESGVFYLDEKNGAFRQVGQGILTREVFSLKVVDSLLMVGDGDGLFALDLNAFHAMGSERIKAYNHLNGFMGIEPNQNCSMIDRDGNFWVIASNQIAFIHKSRLSLEDHPARVRITQINQQKLTFSGKQRIHLPYGENEVKVRFESIGFQRPLRTQYSWRLVGHRDAWSDWSEDQLAFCSNLPGGDYTFEVRSRHPGSVNEDHFISDSVEFRVSLPLVRGPNFYKYALIAGGLFLLAGMVGYHFFGKAKREARMGNQLAQERERLMKFYQIQTLQAQLDPHFIFNLLNTIQSYVEHEKKDDAVEQIQRLAKLLRRFLESSIHSDLGKSNQTIPLSKELELLRYYVELEQVLKPGMFTFAIEVDGRLPTEQSTIIPMMVQPFVENAIKHGLLPKKEADRQLLIRFEKEGAALRCTVKDNGVGMAPTEDQPLRDTLAHQPRGIELVMDRVKLLRELGSHVSIEVKPNPGGGTSVSILFETSFLKK